MWFILGIASGFFHALMSAATKRSIAKTDAYVGAFAQSFFALPFFALALLIPALNWTSPIDPVFWWATLGKVVLNVIALYMFTRALSISELSLTVPLISLTSVFLIFTSGLMLKEVLSTLGIGGIIAIVLGVYILNLESKKRLLSPIKALVKNRGTQLMFGAAFIWSISLNFDKIGIINSSPITYILISETSTALVFMALIWKKSTVSVQTMKVNWKWLAGIGILSAATLISQMVAMNTGMVAYVTSLKRTSTFFSVILGFFMFKEKNLGPKLLGSAFTILGTILIAIS